MRLDRLDRWLGPCLMVLAVIWLFLAYTYIPGARSDAEPGPRAFPVLLGAALFCLGLLITVSSFLASRLPGAAENVLASVTRHEAFIVGGTFSLLVLYAFLLETAGFVLSTPVVVILAMRVLLRRQPWLLTVLLAVGVTSICWLVFVGLLDAPLPRGTWRWWF